MCEAGTWAMVLYHRASNRSAGLVVKHDYIAGVKVKQLHGKWRKRLILKGLSGLAFRESIDFLGAGLLLPQVRLFLQRPLSLSPLAYLLFNSNSTSASIFRCVQFYHTRVVDPLFSITWIPH